MRPLEQGWPNAPESPSRLRSFDGGVVLDSALQRPDRYGFFRAAQKCRHLIARGAGLSYAAASFGGGSVSVDMSAFDRFLNFLPGEMLVTVEAGMRIGRLFKFLAARGLCLSVQPGHGSISVGGCIAADVHGKHPARDGTFARQVESIQLFHPLHGFLDLSADRHPELFRATCGGYGTTGIIVSASLRAAPMSATTVELRRIPVSDIAAAGLELQTLASQSDFGYSWHDCTLSARVFGQGYVISGRFVEDGTVRARRGEFDKARNISAAWRAQLPFALVNRLSSRLLNAMQVMKYERGERVRLSLESGLFPIHGAENYFRAFGRRGFHEYQALIPHRNLGQYAFGLREAALRHKVTIALASAKLFNKTSDLLRFDGEGVSLAVNIPRTANSEAFMQHLDRLVIETEGRPNIIKDSRLPRRVIEAAYPELHRLRAVVRDFDPARLFRSELSERAGL